MGISPGYFSDYFPSLRLFSAIFHLTSFFWRALQCASSRSGTDRLWNPGSPSPLWEYPRQQHGLRELRAPARYRPDSRIPAWSPRHAPRQSAYCPDPADSSVSGSAFCYLSDEGRCWVRPEYIAPPPDRIQSGWPDEFSGTRLRTKWRRIGTVSDSPGPHPPETSAWPAVLSESDAKSADPFPTAANSVKSPMLSGSAFWLLRRY